MKKFKKIAAGLMAVMAMATSVTGISASASNYDDYNYFDELGAIVYFSSPSVTRYESMAINLVLY